MNEDEFERALERGFAEMRARRGPCPAAEKLSGFASDELPADEAASIRTHVAVCGACDAMLVRLRKFEEAKASDLVGAPEQQMRATVFTRLGKWRVVAFVGYALAAAALVCGYLGVLPQRYGERAVASWDLVESIDLSRVRGADAPPASKARSRFVVLTFFVDIRPDLRYEAVLDGGEVKTITSYNGLGNFHLMVDRRLLGPGRHVLTVREANLRTIEFPFETK